MIAINGSGKFVSRFVNQLEKKNIECISITPSLRDIHFKNKIKNYPIIHFFGSPTVTIVGILALIRFRLWRKKIVVSWIGFDVRRTTNNKFWKLTSKLLQTLIDINLVDDENIVQELQESGITSQKQPLPVYVIYPLRNLPKEKRIAIYLPDKLPADYNFFQGPLIKRLVNEFPEVEFIITSNSGKYFVDDKNVKCIPWVENMEELYNKVMAVIRLPLHDATGATIIETLAMGRTMIASATDFPYCKIVKTFDDAKNYVNQIISKPILNKEASDYVHNLYDNDNLTNEIISIYKKLDSKTT